MSSTLAHKEQKPRRDRIAILREQVASLKEEVESIKQREKSLESGKEQLQTLNKQLINRLKNETNASFSINQAVQVSIVVDMSFVKVCRNMKAQNC